MPHFEGKPVDIRPYPSRAATEQLEPGSSALLSDVEHEQVFESDIKPFLDPVLKHSTRKLGRVYARLARSGMLQFSKGKMQETVGIFLYLRKPVALGS